MTTAIDTIRRFPDLRVVIIGDAMLDSYVQGTATRLCSEGPGPVVSKISEERYPGGAANTAANLRALGAEVACLGIVGADAAGQQLRSCLRDLDVDDSWLIEDERIPTIHKLRLCAGDTFLVRLDEGEPLRPDPARDDRLLSRLSDALTGANLLVVSDYGYGAVSDALIARLRGLSDGKPIVVDAKHVRRYRSAGATLLTPNHLEACNAVDAAAQPDPSMELAEVEDIGHSLFSMVDAANLAVTVGERGVLLYCRDEASRHITAHPVPHADSVGAGDSFMAAAALALGAGASCADAVAIGIEAGAIAVGKRRTAVVQHDELLRRMDRRDEAMQPDVWPLAARLERERAAGRRVVFTNGVFDLLHAGHVQFLQAAKALGDVLVVGINSDASTRRLKGNGRPITSERDRLALVAALDAVDYAILFEEDTPASLIRALRPHVHVKGGDYTGRELPEADALREVDALSVILPRIGDASTTNVLHRILGTAPTREVAASGLRRQA